MKTTKLTPEQQEKLIEFRDECLAIGLSCEPVDAQLATETISAAYKIMGLKVPEIRIVSSPLAANKLINKISKKKANNYTATYLWGASDIYWIAFYLFPEMYLGITYPKESSEKLHIMYEIAKNTGWWYPFENLCIVSDRPEYIKCDDQKRLHSATGPAILYRDGFAVYQYHGVDIPKEWILEKNLTPAQALTWKNVEQRNAACQILGWKDILKSLEAEIIDADPNPYLGTLYSATMPGGVEQKFLAAKCGTGREIVILASSKAKTAREAGALSYGIPVTDYNPEART